MSELLQENGDALLQETGDFLLLDILTLPFRTRISAIRFILVITTVILQF